jgi:hypothetical protein
VTEELQRNEVLCIPRRRRLVHNRYKGTEGQDVLHVFYGEKEIVFDEPELLPFGDKLLSTERFRAEEAMSWSNGSPLEWEKVRDLLEALLAEEILKRVAEGAISPAAQSHPATLGLAPADLEPRTFSTRDDRCQAMTREAFGREIELANLEAVIPVYRVAHPTLDLDGRQVGENNVTPRPLFLDRPTQRRTCNYPGSRCQADVPMNVTALRHMTQRWPELLSLTEQYRRAFFARLPPQDTSLQAGEVHLLTVGCLASVGYVMVRGVDPVENGQLDAGLAAMFRLIDGVRLVTTEIMRDTTGRHGCDRPVDAKSIGDFAEQRAMYYGTYGVCAGPQALIEEYLRVLLDGASAPIETEPPIALRLGDIEAALDYGLHGQRIESLIRIFGASQGIQHQRLRAAFGGNAPRIPLQDGLDQPIDSQHFTLLREDHALVDQFELEIQVNRWLFARSGAGLSEHAGDEAEDLLRIDPAGQAVERHRVADFLAQVVPGHRALAEPLRVALAEVSADVFALERRCLRAVRDEQMQMNERLRRPQGRPLTGADLAIYYRPRTGPPFETTLAQGLGLSITTDATATVLRHGDHALSLAG